MSAEPSHFMDEREETRDSEADEEAESTFWHWFALGALIFAWIAEATMCAERGF